MCIYIYIYIYIKRAECIVELYKHERSAEKQEPKASPSRAFRVFIKIPACLYNSTMHEEQVFLFLLQNEKRPRRDKNSSDYKNEREF